MSTFYKFSPENSGVTEINGLSSDVTLVGVDGITITVNGQDIEIGGGGGGAGVDSVNGLTGALTLAAGTNITLTPVGNTITIDAASGGAVDSVNGQTGVVVLDADDVGAANQTLSNLTSPTAINQDLLSAANNTVDLGASGNQFLQLHVHDIQSTNDLAPDGEAGSFVQNEQRLNVRPDSASPDYQSVLMNRVVSLDPDSSGFALGTNASAAIIEVTQFDSLGANSDIGQVIFESKNFSVGNGTDPTNLEGFQYVQGFGQVNSGAVISGPITGFTFSPSFQTGSSMSTSAYVTAYLDNLNSAVELPSHVSFQAGPNISSIANNHNYNGFQVSASIDTFTGNANFTGLGVFPNLGTFDTGSFQGVVVSPNIDMTNSAVGISVSMDNVTVTAGAPSVLVIQDLTITASIDGTAGNSVTFAYTGGGTAGAEVVSGTFPAFSVQIQSGVSTATQVKAALDGYGPLATLITTVISGVGSNPQVTQAATNMSGGIDPGQKLAARFDGDVQIDGSLSFTGGLSIGALSSFAEHTIVDGTGTPTSIDTLITAPSVGDNETITNADTLAINTAMLLTVGDNSSISTSFLGLTALGLPAVVSMGSGSTIDRVAAAAFAISLDASATGGTIEEVDLCRAIAIPNGATTVDRLMGFKMDMPFGDVGTELFGVYVTPTAMNYMAGSLKIGGTPGSDDTPTNSSVGLELESTTKAFLPSRMTTTQRDALTALDGMVIYNTTTQTTQAHENGVWVDLSGGGGGANVTLSNLTSPTAVNETLTFDSVTQVLATPDTRMEFLVDTETLAFNIQTGNMTIVTSDTNTFADLTVKTADVTGLASGVLTLESGDSDGSNSSGVVIRSGNSEVETGPIEIYTASNSDTGGISGLIALTTGDSDLNTGEITLVTGNSGNGDSGPIILTTGTADNGTRGQIAFVDGSEGAAGQVWTSTDANGNGAWTDLNNKAYFMVDTCSSAGSPTTAFVYTNVVIDSHSGYSAGSYTIPTGQGGLWHFDAAMESATTGVSPIIFKGSTQMYQGTANSNVSIGMVGANILVSDGDVVTIRPNNAATMSGSNPTFAYFQGYRVI